MTDRTLPPALTVDIGGTHLTTAVVEVAPRTRVRFRKTCRTPAADGPRAVLTAAARLARDSLADARTAGGPRVTAVGVGSAGVVGRAGRGITGATDALPGWAGTPVADRLEAALGLPVTVLGDVQAFLLGEVTAGAAAGADGAVGVMAGTGIGGAVWAEGRLLRGAHGAAGHLGHVPVPGADGEVCPCGRTGHVEALASGPAMTERFRRAHPGPGVTDLRDVAALAAQGDPDARAALAAGGRALGTALGGVVGALDPDVVVVGGGVTHSGPWYLDGLRTALYDTALPALARVRVATAALGSDAVLVGAAHAAGAGPAADGAAAGTEAVR
ncbi:ROK family protein [Streptomyces sp. MAR4 CNX-425]|uniref:ROK family protein n=1 Tax=Streptomyces sp. MAR4 CNX-425 TaxID=3406343 RepID=UPI003B50215B